MNDKPGRFYKLSAGATDYRWGELIFQSHDINIGWDGYIRGSLAAQGVYLWKVTLVYKNGSPDSLAGDITLLWKRAQ